MKKCCLFLIGISFIFCWICALCESKGTVNTEDVFFRAAPSTEAQFYLRFSKGTEVTVLSETDDFYKITYDGTTGYIMKKFLTVSGQKSQNEKSSSRYASATSISALGDAPNICASGSRGEDVEKLQKALSLKGYYNGLVDGIFGNQTEQALLAYQKDMKLPETGKGDYATILKLFGKVSYTTVENDPGMNGITKISQITVPATSRSGDENEHVTALQQALKIKGLYQAPIDGSFGKKTEEAVKAFQESKGLTADGIAGNNTIKALFGKNAANCVYKTEQLDWFNGGETVIPKGGEFTVKDIKTGKTFKVRRWSGYNHLDAEPLTAEDTQIMYEIYGKEWSWSRRAILVKYKDHVYAASMNGMPHGEQTIYDNDFDGQFCIHFYQSKTHGSDRVDEGHQSAVSRAMSAEW